MAATLLSIVFFAPVKRALAQDRGKYPDTRSTDTHNQAQTARGTQGNDQHKDNEPAPVPPEKPWVTHHDMNLGGKNLRYTATAGTLVIRDEEDKPYGSMFYVAYTLDGAESRMRPVSFLYNGGPGSATLWLHMGSFRRCALPPTARTRPRVRRSSWRQTNTRCSTRPTWSLSSAPDRLFARRRQGPAQGLFRRRPGSARFRPLHRQLSERESALEFAQVSDWRVVRHDALRRSRRHARQRRLTVQRSGSHLVDSELQHSRRRLWRSLRRQPAQLRCCGMVLRQIPNKPPDLGAWVQQAREFASARMPTRCSKGTICRQRNWTRSRRRSADLPA